MEGGDALLCENKKQAYLQNVCKFLDFWLIDNTIVVVVNHFITIRTREQEL